MGRRRTASCARLWLGRRAKADRFALSEKSSLSIPCSESDDETTMCTSESDRSIPVPEQVVVLDNREEESSESSSHRKPKVGFSTVEVRNYSVVLGDHPCCSTGCPLALGWDFTEGGTVALDEFESSRPPRRSIGALKTTWESRKELLTNEGLSELEIRKAQRRHHRQQRSSGKMSESFFGSEA